MMRFIRNKLFAPGLMHPAQPPPACALARLPQRGAGSDSPAHGSLLRIQGI